MFDYLFGLFSRNLGIDLGTANTLVIVQGEGIKIAEPSVVATNKKTGELVAVGSEAEPMLGKTPPDIVAVKPLREGVISDFPATIKMLNYYIKKLHPDQASRILGARPKVVVGVPSAITPVEKRAVIKALQEARARKVYLVDEPMVASIGAKLDVGSPKGSFIVDIGGGTSEIALISLSGIVQGTSLRKAGESMDINIVQYVKRERGLVIGRRTAERAKIQAGSALGKEAETSLKTVVRGRETSSGLPRAVEIGAGEIAQAVSPTLSAIAKTIKKTLEESPPELVADVQQTGITLAGGGCLLRKLDQYLEKELGIKVRRAENPQTCVARGCGYLLENKELLKRVANYD